MRVARVLVREHHVGNRDSVSVVVLHDVAHVGLVDNLGAVTSATSSDESSETFVRQRFANTYCMVAYLTVEGCNHVFPVVVVGRHEDDTAAGIIEWFEDFLIFKNVAFAYLAKRGASVEKALGNQVA